MTKETGPRTLARKIWDDHVIAEREKDALLWVDRHLLHEGSFHAFNQIEKKALTVAHPELTLGIADHYVPTRQRHGPIDPQIRSMIDQLSSNTAKHQIRLFDLDDRNQGIVHVSLPEQGATLPGLITVCGDSHTSTHGAFGAYAFGIGASEVAHVLATQTIWQKCPKNLRIRVEGSLAEGVTAKDIALTLINRIGANGAQGYAIEYAGSAIRALSMEGRMTLCNMSIEAGGRLGLVAPDETTFSYLQGRTFAPKGTFFEQAVENWRTLVSDPDAFFDRDILFNAEEIAPSVTWGTSPEQALPIDSIAPDPSRIDQPEQAAIVRDALEYMDIRPGTPLEAIRIDRVFIGSCTNSRIEDLRAAAKVLSGRKAVVPGLVSPGSMEVKRRAEQEGLDSIFREAGLSWEESGCSMCVGMNGDIVRPGERCASTTNRNFKGRQGPGSRTHLMSPAMVAAAAVTGHLTDVRRFSDR
jgi:3-isopropylmalate/(R)-2-methylmalate dehydratase large subunit